MTAPAGTSSEAPDAASPVLPHPAAKPAGRTRTASVTSSLRMCPRIRGEIGEALEPDRNRPHTSGAVRLDQREAEREILDRQARVAEQRSPAGSGTPRMGAGQ